MKTIVGITEVLDENKLSKLPWSVAKMKQQVIKKHR
jgi:hypothetical protein